MRFNKVEVVRSGIQSEAEIGKIEYLDVDQYKLVFHGELLVPREEVEEYEETYNIQPYPESVQAAGAPFFSWEDLIKVVSQRTPQARHLVRYLESNDYHNILKMYVRVDEEDEELSAKPRVIPAAKDENEGDEAEEWLKSQGKPVSKPQAAKKLLPVSPEEAETDENLKLAPFLLTASQLEDKNIKSDKAYEEATKLGIPARRVLVHYDRALLGNLAAGEENDPRKRRELIDSANIFDLGDGIIYGVEVGKNYKGDRDDAKIIPKYLKPSDYNRYWFNMLRKYAPRAKKPEAHGGEKIKMRNIEGSPKWLASIRKPLIKKFLENYEDEIKEELRMLFSVLPNEWQDSFLGPEGNLVRIEEDPKSESLARTSNWLGAGQTSMMSTLNRHEYARLERVLKSLEKKKANTTDPKSRRDYKKAADEIEDQMDELIPRGNRFKVYFVIGMPMRHFIRDLRREIHAQKPMSYAERMAKSYGKVGTKISAATKKRLGDLYTVETSLENFGDWLELFEASGEWHGLKFHLGLAEDFYHLFSAIIKSAYSRVAQAKKIDNLGNIYFTMESSEWDWSRAEEPEEEPEEEDYSGS